MPAGSGRKLAPEWSEVIDFGDKTKCKHCHEVISKRAQRIKQHLQKCKKRISSTASFSVDHPPSSSATNIDNAGDLEPPSKCIVLESSEGLSSCAVSKSSTEQKSILSYGVTTTASQKTVIDQKIAKFFYANNVAFNVANNKHFIDMVAALRPGYNPPNSAQLSGKLLDDVCKEVELNLKQEISEQICLTLILDGWTNNKNDSIFACNIHTGTKSYLLKATDCGSEKKTAEFCANIGKLCIEEIKEKYGRDIFAICADNENKMNAVNEKLKLAYPNVITYGCSAHIMNLCIKDIIPNNLVEHIVKVQKHFRNKHRVHGWLIEKNGLMPQIPCDTRWNSYQECLGTFVANFHKYNEIRLEHMEEFNQQISNILTNAGVYSEASNLLNQLKILSQALNNLQNDTSTLSDAVQTWLHILNDKVLEHYRPQLMKRFAQNIQPFHLLALMTDPNKGFGEQLSAEQEELAEQWLHQTYPKLLPYLLKLKIKDSDTFPKAMFNFDIVSNFSAKKWWHIMKEKVMKRSDNTAAELKELCEFLMKLHSWPPTSASIERIFSCYGLIWSKLRNRLGAKKAENLVKIYKFFKTDAEDNDC